MCIASAALGSGVILETWTLPGVVIPAQAGIHSSRPLKGIAYELDSRLRGNDGRFGRKIIQMTPLPIPAANRGCERTGGEVY